MDLLVVGEHSQLNCHSSPLYPALRVPPTGNVRQQRKFPDAHLHMPSWPTVEIMLRHLQRPAVSGLSHQGPALVDHLRGDAIGSREALGEDRSDDGAVLSLPMRSPTTRYSPQDCDVPQSRLRPTERDTHDARRQPTRLSPVRAGSRRVHAMPAQSDPVPEVRRRACATGHHQMPRTGAHFTRRHRDSMLGLVSLNYNQSEFTQPRDMATPDPNPI